MKFSKVLLVVEFFIALSFRVSGIMWDGGYHFHPDERMLIMTADKIHFFNQLNPDFFNYGSLPLYMLKGTSQLIDFLFSTHLATYDGMLLIGRMLSLTCDMLTLVVLYKVSQLLFKNKAISYWSVLFYATCIFAIQNSHFFVVDVFLTCFTLFATYFLLLYIRSGSLSILILTSLMCAAAVTTKFSGIVTSGLIMSAVTVNECVLFFRQQQQNRILRVVFILIAGTTFTLGCVLFMPYAFDLHLTLFQIFNAKFINDVTLQTTMNKDPYIFPYTLQYVGTTAYLYYLKNIFLWGAGPLMSFCALVGLGIGLSKLLTIKKLIPFLLISFVFIPYFAIMGRSAVKFMRYMLPIYPIIALFAGYGVTRMLIVARSMKGRRAITTTITMAVLIGTLGWAYGFNAIYRRPSTRIQATEWINSTIPKGKTLAVEHWDDRVPIFDPGFYKYEEMTLYELPDDAGKWHILDEKLSRTDYIILASNRLYVPLQRLADCTKYRVCYPQTAVYYQHLFSGKLPFSLVADFHSYPTWNLGIMQLELPDDGADESFTVYDHPRILIFKRTRGE